MLSDKTSNLPANFFTFHKGALNHTVVIGPPRVGMSNTFNPFSNTKEDVDFTIALLVQIFGGQVGESVEAKAREVLVAESANKNDLCLLDIVEAFERVPELQEFARRLRHYALPGAFGKYFNPDEGRRLLHIEDMGRSFLFSGNPNVGSLTGSF